MADVAVQSVDIDPQEFDVGAFASMSPPAMIAPLCLLLSLIRQHDVDVFDIPIAFITERYVEALTALEAVTDVQVGGEFIELASELVHIKSRLLLPRPPRYSDEPGQEEGDDPRAELVERLLELARFQEAGEQLMDRPLLGVDTFPRSSFELTPQELHEARPLAPVPVWKLAEAFGRVAKRHQLFEVYDVGRQGLSIRERIVQIADLLAKRHRLRFDDLLVCGDVVDRVTTFCAVLEAARLGILRVFQAVLDDGELHVEAAGLTLDDVQLEL